MSQSGRAVAIVGASESTMWTFWYVKNLRDYGYPGEIWPVNPNRASVYDIPTFPSIEDLPGTPDTALIILRADQVPAAARKLTALGVPELVVVSDGFRETMTEEGVDLENQLVQLTGENGTTLVGPNCVGYASFHESYVGIAEPIPSDIKAGNVSVISQSGVLTHTALAVLKSESIGVDRAYSIGNGAQIGFERACALLAARLTTRVVCAVVESISNRQELAEAVHAGRERGVEFVFLMLGQSDNGKRVAKSHTGAVTGDQRIVRSWMRGIGAIVVNSLEELGRTAKLLVSVGRPSTNRGVFVVAGSGGASGMTADLAAAKGLPLAEISEATRTAIKGIVLPGTEVGNPLDMTNRQGAAGNRQIVDLLLGDPAVGMLLNPMGIGWPDDSFDYRFHRASFEQMFDAAAQASKPIIYASIQNQPTTDFMARNTANTESAIVDGLELTVSSLARLYTHGRLNEQTGSTTVTGPVAIDRSVVDEAPAREILQALRLPVVPGVVAGSPGEASAASEAMPAPWVVKLALSGLGHKGKVGGVQLGVTNSADIQKACEKMSQSVVAAGLGEAKDVKFMVQQMVFGPEVLVGLVRDTISGPSLILGPGGWLAESGDIFASFPLGLSEVTIAEELGRSRLPHLLGREKLGDLTKLLTELAREFVDGQLRDYEEVECNPVIMTANGPVIADVLLVKRPDDDRESDPLGARTAIMTA